MQVLAKENHASHPRGDGWVGWRNNWERVWGKGPPWLGHVERLWRHSCHQIDVLICFVFSQLGHCLVTPAMHTGSLPHRLGGDPQQHGDATAAEMAPIAEESVEVKKELQKCQFPAVEGDTAPHAMVPKACASIQKQVGKLDSVLGVFKKHDATLNTFQKFGAYDIQPCSLIHQLLAKDEAEVGRPHWRAEQTRWWSYGTAWWWNSWRIHLCVSCLCTSPKKYVTWKVYPSVLFLIESVFWLNGCVLESQPLIIDVVGSWTQAGRKDSERLGHRTSKVWVLNVQPANGSFAMMGYWKTAPTFITLTAQVCWKHSNPPLCKARGSNTLLALSIDCGSKFKYYRNYVIDYSWMTLGENKHFVATNMQLHKSTGFVIKASPALGRGLLRVSLSSGLSRRLHQRPKQQLAKPGLSSQRTRQSDGWRGRRVPSW